MTLRLMRQRLLVCVLVAATSCGDNPSQPDASVHIDAARVDAPDAVSADAAPDASLTPSDLIAAARAVGTGTGLALSISGATVTFLKPQLGSMTNDPAGFTIQASQAGPGLFVAVDPATLTPVPAVGDVVSFTITTMGTVGQQPRVQAITGFARTATGTDVTALAKSVSAATDLVSAEDMYDSELVTVTGTVFENLAASGTGFLKAGLTTAGIAADPNLQLRAPATLVTSLDIAQNCMVTLHNVPVSRFNAATQFNVYGASDISLMGCPAPTVVNAISLSPTSVRVTFTRNVLAGTVMANGSQFTFDNGLVATAATVAGQTVTLTTGAQLAGTTYTVTVAATVTDLQGSAVATPTTAMFSGFVTPAVVRINEVNANIAGGCDLIELRVIAGGTIGGFKLLERTGGNGELSLTFPSVTVAKNDFIVVHMNSASATCNPGAATQETTGPAQQPAATFGGNFDTAYDFWSTDTGLTSTDNVFTLLDATPAIVDALFASDDPAGPTAAANTETQAALVGAANQWSPALATYLDTVFRTNAVDDLNATGTTSAGTSIQRLDDTDDNDKADWTTGAGAASTWGALNPGQTAL